MNDAQPHQSPKPPDERLPRKSASPLLWIIVLFLAAALIWLGYSFFIRKAQTPSFPTTGQFFAGQHSNVQNVSTIPGRI